MSNRTWPKARLALASAAIVSLCFATGMHVAKAAASPSILVSPASQTVALASNAATVQIQIRDAADVASFQFVLRYDAGVVAQPSVTVGPFLGSTGRNVTCLPAIVDGPRGPGTVEFGCATQPLSNGVDGSGVLATVNFKLTGGSSTSLSLEKVTVANATGYPVCGSGCLTTTGGSIGVTGGNAGGNQGLSPSPTPAAAASDPTGTQQPVNGGPGVSGQLPSGGQSASAPPGGAEGGDPGLGSAPSTATSGATPDGASSGQAGSTGRPSVARLGSGPRPPGHERRNALIASSLLVCVGVALLCAGRAGAKRFEVRRPGR